MQENKRAKLSESADESPKRANPHKNDLEQGTKRFRDGALFVGIVGICLLLVVSLVAISQGSGSAQSGNISSVPSSNLTSDQACAAWAHYWIDESGIKVSAGAIAAFSNCRIAKDGTWFMPTSSQDPRLQDGPILSREDYQQVISLRTLISQQMVSMRTALPGDLTSALNAIYSPQANPVMGHTKDTRIGPVRDDYTEFIQSYLDDQNNRELANYVGWLMNQRQQGFAEFMAGCDTKDMRYLKIGCQSIGDRLSVDYPPWPWELSNSINLDTYLKWVLDNDVFPNLGTPTP